MEILIVWLILSILVGLFAAKKGRSGAGFFLLALLLSPLIGLLIALIVAPGEPDRSGQQRCRYCAEWINRAAIKCKHCGADIAAPADEDDGKRHPTAIDPPYRGADGYRVGASIGKLVGSIIGTLTRRR